jgi:hypothetical protein
LDLMKSSIDAVMVASIDESYLTSDPVKFP